MPITPVASSATTQTDGFPGTKKSKKSGFHFSPVKQFQKAANFLDFKSSSKAYAYTNLTDEQVKKPEKSGQNFQKVRNFITSIGGLNKKHGSAKKASKKEAVQTTPSKSKQHAPMQAPTVSFLKSLMENLTPEISAEGVYRLSPQASKLNNAKEKYDSLKITNRLRSDSYSDVFSEIPERERVLVGSVLLKSIITDETGIFSEELYKKHLANINTNDPVEVLNAVKALAMELDPQNKELFIELMKHLRLVSNASASNRMPVSNLSKIFAPVIISMDKSPSQALEMLDIYQKLTDILQICIEMTDLSQTTHWLDI